MLSLPFLQHLPVFTRSSFQQNIFIQSIHFKKEFISRKHNFDGKIYQ